MEFPLDATIFRSADQFMWGDAILVSPKIKKALISNKKYFFPSSEDDPGKWWSIDVYLPMRQLLSAPSQKPSGPKDTVKEPPGLVWYYYGSK